MVIGSSHRALLSLAGSFKTSTQIKVGISEGVTQNYS